MFEARTYRKMHSNAHLDSFEVSFLETDLWIGIDKGKYAIEIKIFALEKIKELRTLLVGYQIRNQHFISSLQPLPFDDEAPGIVKEMLLAAIKTNTGPMSCVAGIFASFVGEAIRKKFQLHNVIVENGGDNYLFLSNITAIVPIDAGENDVSHKLGLKIHPSKIPIGICTSSGKIGHSFSFGKADAVTVVSKNIALADSFATSICNQVKTKYDLEDIITKYGHHPEIETLIIIMDDSVAIIGDHEVVIL